MKTNNKRALIIAPTYDGSFLTTVPGGSFVSEKLTEVLQRHGQFECVTKMGNIGRAKLRKEIRKFADTGGSLLFYFYGHGLINDDGDGILCTSDAEQDDEGLSMLEVTKQVIGSQAIEAITVFDCCHSGQVVDDAIQALSAPLSGCQGRAIFASCAAKQEAWVSFDEESQQSYSGFAKAFIEGLSGRFDAALSVSGAVRASTLADYLNEQFGDWSQRPLNIVKAGGDRLMTITSGFESKEKKSGRSRGKCKLFGVPFRPSVTFVGRAAEIDSLETTVRRRTHQVALSASVEGVGGIGKTELAIQFVHGEMVSDIFDWVIWLDASAPIEPQLFDFVDLQKSLGFFRSIKEVLSSKDQRADDIVKDFHTCLAKAKALVVFDNAEEWTELSSVAPSGASVLVTTRAKDFGGNSFSHLELDVLSDDGARELLFSMAPDLKSDPAAERLLRFLGGHALAIELAGATIASLALDAEQYLDHSRSKSSLPKEVLARVKYGRTVEDCLRVSWNTLKHDASRLLWKRAALFAPVSASRDLLQLSAVGERRNRFLRDFEVELRELGLSTDDTQSLFLIDDQQFRHAYGELRSRHLISREFKDQQDKWSMHRHVRDFGRNHIRTLDFQAHAFTLSEALRDERDDRISVDAPHFVTLILDDFRYSSGIDLDRQRYYYSSRRSLFRGLDSVRDPESFIRYLKKFANDTGVLKVLFEGLVDANEDVRRSTVRLLEGVAGQKEILEGVVTTLDDPSPIVRATARKSLVDSAGPQVTLALKEIAVGSEARAPLEATMALSQIGEPAKDELFDITQRTSDKAVELEASLGLLEAGDVRKVDYVFSSLASLSGNQIDRTHRACLLSAPERYLQTFLRTLSEDGPEKAAVFVKAMSDLNIKRFGQSKMTSGFSGVFLKVFDMEIVDRFSKDTHHATNLICLFIKSLDDEETELKSQEVTDILQRKTFLDLASVVHHIDPMGNMKAFPIFEHVVENQRVSSDLRRKFAAYFASYPEKVHNMIDGLIDDDFEEALGLIKATQSSSFIEPLVARYESNATRKSKKLILETLEFLDGGTAAANTLKEKEKVASEQTNRSLQRHIGGGSLRPEAEKARIYAVDSNGEKHEIYGSHGLTLMEVLRDEGIPGIEADCGGACACSTCHVYIAEHWQDRLNEVEAMEKDMLDFAYEPDERSRLTCQITVDSTIDGIELEIPEKQI